MKAMGRLLREQSGYRFEVVTTHQERYEDVQESEFTYRTREEAIRAMADAVKKANSELMKDGWTLERK